MKIRKAVITAAGPGQRNLLLQTLVDRDGVGKTALSILLQEASEAGIESIGIVVQPGMETAFQAAAELSDSALEWIPQPEPLGYAHAIACAAPFAGEDPFLLMVGDHIYVSNQTLGCARQLVAVAESTDCSVSAVQATHESKLPFYGTIGGRRIPSNTNQYEITDILEKPTPTEAEQHLNIPGLRAGYYLCLFGMHVFSPTAMPLIQGLLKDAGDPKSGTKPNGRLLAQALTQLAGRERYLACEVDGQRYDLGMKYGFLTAQLALALAGQERSEVLAQMMELIVRTLPSPGQTEKGRPQR